MRFRSSSAGYAVLAFAVTLAGCSGGGASVGSLQPSHSGVPSSLASATPSPVASATAQPASGTLTLVVSQLQSATNARHRNFVSPLTIHAALFIDGATSPAGTLGSENPSPAPDLKRDAAATCGYLPSCTIAWSTTAGPHTLAVEIDGDKCLVASEVCTTSPDAIYAEAETTFTAVPGTGNNLNLTPNGVAGSFFWVADRSSTANSITGVYEIGDDDDGALTYPLTTPGGFDDGPITLTADQSSLTSGSAFVTTTGSSSTLSAPDANGADYPFTVACSTSPPANGTFTVVASAGHPSGDITAAEMTANSLEYVYFNGFTGGALPSASPTYTCTDGVISDALGGGTIE